jgi:hypothetical protein
MLVNNDTQKSPQDTTTKLFGDSLNTSERLRKLVDLNVSYKDIPTEIASDLCLKSWDGGPGHLMSGVDPITGEPWFLGLQFKPDVPWVYTDKNGKKSKPAKYLTASGHGICPLFAEMPEAEFWQKVISAPSTPVVITEGFKKAMVGLAAEYPTISISGVDCWREGKELHSLLKLFAVKGRTVYLAFDMDLFTNGRVLAALKALGGAIEKEGAAVKVMLWESKLKGLDDYLLDRGLDAITPIIRDALTLDDWSQKVSNKLMTAATRIRRSLGQKLRYNDMSHRVEMEGATFPLPTAKDTLEYRYGLVIDLPDKRVSYLVDEIAKEDTYHPVRDYLEEVHTLYGDDTAILNDLASKVFGAHDPLDQILLRRWGIAAVARAHEPGCQVDTVLVLKGPQGAGKSTFFRELASPKWFTDSVHSITEKDTLLALHRFWIVELSELGAATRKKDVEQVKIFISRREDTLRRPYGTGDETLKRTFILGASTNEDAFLPDATGNRRFWPVTVGTVIDNSFVKEHRDKIWAAFVSLFRSGEQWRLTDDEEALLKERVKGYRIPDEWEAEVLKIAGPSGRVTTDWILGNLCGPSVVGRERGAAMRVGKILVANDWVRKQVWNKTLKKQEWVYEKGWVEPIPN